MVAVQGPKALEICKGLTEVDAGQLKYYFAAATRCKGKQCVVSRTGYTGEDGFEVILPAESAGELWDELLSAGAGRGVLPAGLGARDATRLEAALRLWGNDMDETVNPYEAGLGWTVKLGKRDFVGRGALEKIKADGPRRQLVGLKMQPGDIARHGAAVSAKGERIGIVTSGTHSFFLGYPIAMAMVEARSLQVGDQAVVEVRGRQAPAEVVKLPFYRGSARSISEKKESRHG